MHTFTVWAPNASAVSLVLRSGALKMAETDDVRERSAGEAD